MRVDPLYRGEPGRVAQEAVRDFEDQLLLDEHLPLQQGVERESDRPLRRVLHRNDAARRLLALDGVEYPLDAGGLAVSGREPEEVPGGDMRKCPFGTEKSDLERLLEGQAATHDLAKNGPDGPRGERSRPLGREPGEHPA